jgi:hypothetical protein
VVRSSTTSVRPRIVVDRAYMPPLLPGNGDAPAASPRRPLCSFPDAGTTAVAVGRGT